MSSEDRQRLDSVSMYVSTSFVPIAICSIPHHLARTQTQSFVRVVGTFFMLLHKAVRKCTALQQS
jgi:hypothetical protein